MTVKLMVLYPHPRDELAFERRYVGKHLPLMRELLGPRVRIPTYRTLGSPERPSPYYRVAEIHFDDLEHFNAFARSEQAELGRRSSIEVSTGGMPLTLVCVEQDEI